MNKQLVRAHLLRTFSPGAVNGWLAAFGDDHVFDPATYCRDFVTYMNALPVPGRLPEEDDYDY